jgi:hypothetical protein
VSVAKYARPLFTDNFRNALQFLNESLVLPENEQMARYRAFVMEFGTHYITKTDLGASLFYQKIYKV